MKISDVHYEFMSRERIDRLDERDISPPTLARLIDESINDEEERSLPFKERKEKEKRDWILSVSYSDPDNSNLRHSR